MKKVKGRVLQPGLKVRVNAADVFSAKPGAENWIVGEIEEVLDTQITVSTEDGIVFRFIGDVDRTWGFG